MTRLNAIELGAMNNPVRRFLQRRLELRTFERMLASAGIVLRDRRLLDAGCGSGYSSQLICQRFRPRELVAFDLMPEQIERARRRYRSAADFRVGSISQIEEPDESFDAAFVFGVLHHVPEWRRALSELGRVLVPGGVLLVEELHGRFVDLEDRFLFTSHPREARFDWDTFSGAIADAGLSLLEERPLVGWAAHSFLCKKPLAAA